MQQYPFRSARQVVPETIVCSWRSPLIEYGARIKFAGLDPPSVTEEQADDAQHGQEVEQQHANDDRPGKAKFQADAQQPEAEEKEPLNQCKDDPGHA